MKRASKVVVTLTLFVLFAGLLASCSKCGQKTGPEAEPTPAAGDTQKMAQPAQPAGNVPPPTVGPQQGTGKVLTAEEFYNLMFERQQISLDFQEKRLAILKKHGSYNEKAREELMKINNETAQQQRDIMDKFGINYIDLRNAMQNQEMQAANNEYMRSHPEIQEKLKVHRERQMALSKELQPFEDKIREEMRQQQPPAPAAPQSAPQPAPATPAGR